MPARQWTWRLPFPILCRFDESGKPATREVTSAETGKLLGAALDLEDEKPNKIRSHSLKVTMLGWAAKGGMDLPSRRILGHHLDPGAKAAEIYGRDSISSAIRKMCGVLALIKQGRFSPLTARDLEGSPTLQIKIIMCSLNMTLQIVTPRWQLLTYLKHPRSWIQRKIETLDRGRPSTMLHLSTCGRATKKSQKDL